MSGYPKYSEATMNARRQEQLRQEQARREAAERKRQEEAARRAREARIAEERDEASRRIDRLESQLQGAKLMPNDSQALSDVMNQLRQKLKKSQSPSRLYSEISSAAAALQEAGQRFQREEEKRLDRLARVEAAAKRLESVMNRSANKSAKFDPGGRDSCLQALSTVEQARSAGTPDRAEERLREAESMISSHLAKVQNEQEKWAEQKQSAENALAEAFAILEGLAADEIMMRWHHPRIEESRSELQRAQKKVEDENFEAGAQFLADLQQQIKDWTSKSSELEIEVAKRDYIAQSLQGALESMGYTTVLDEETPDHPLTAKRIRSAAGNKSVEVNIPINGQVMYMVEGFPMQVTSNAEGMPVKACDAAVLSLSQLHQVLADNYGLNMGEIWWEGKDPIDEFGEKDEIPSSDEKKGRHR